MRGGPRVRLTFLQWVARGGVGPIAHRPSTSPVDCTAAPSLMDVDDRTYAPTSQSHRKNVSHTPARSARR